MNREIHETLNELVLIENEIIEFEKSKQKIEDVLIKLIDDVVQCQKKEKDESLPLEKQ